MVILGNSCLSPVSKIVLLPAGLRSTVSYLRYPFAPSLYLSNTQYYTTRSLQRTVQCRPTKVLTVRRVLHDMPRRTALARRIQ